MQYSSQCPQEKRNVLFALVLQIMLELNLFVWFAFFETGFHCVAHVGLEFESVGITDSIFNAQCTVYYLVFSIFF